MTATAGRDGRAGTAGRRVSGRLVGLMLLVVVIAAIAIDTTYKDSDEPLTVDGRVAFSTETYGEENFPRVASVLERSAVPLPRLFVAIGRDLDAAGEQFGQRQGSSPWNFAVSGEGIAGRAENGLLPIRVRGLPADATVSVQIGPAINGTTLRDAAGFIEFGQFTNQVEYAGAATALNEQVKAQVLGRIDAAALNGRPVRFVGATSIITPEVLTVTPVRLAAGA